jgi:hypothetical protein
LEACEKRTLRVSSTSLVRYRNNDYSVPTEYGHREVLVKGYVHGVVIARGSQVIARHRRSYEREDMVFDPLHYLGLLEQKTRALDQAAPLAGWELPACFAQLRRLLESRLHQGGRREYVQVLRLLETFSLAEVRPPLTNGEHQALNPENPGNGVPRVRGILRPMERLEPRSGTAISRQRSSGFESISRMTASTFVPSILSTTRNTPCRLALVSSISLPWAVWSRILMPGRR